MRTVAISYLPGETDQRFGCLDFVKNLAENPPAGDLILFSDHPQPTAESLGFPVIRLNGSVEHPSLTRAIIQRPQTGEVVPNMAAVNNMVFLSAVRICKRQGYSHILYLESDVRVKNPPGGHWDKIIFDEFFSHSRHLICAGTIMAFNVANQDRASLERWERFLWETKEGGRKLPIAPYGWLSAADGKGSCVFPNGAGGVYSIAGLDLLIPEREEKGDGEVAASSYSWDFDLIGRRLWEKFKGDTWEVIQNLNSVCSHYGDIQSSLAERLQWLEEGRFVLVHQVKTK